MNIPANIHADNAVKAEDCYDPARLARLLAALGHPARIEILGHLSGIEACCCKDVVGRMPLAQSTVSQHLKVLHDAGLVRRTPQGQRSCYAVDRQALLELSGVFDELLKACAAGTPQPDKQT